jgi:enoyl-CoA hydratase/carnithine racemase
MLFGGGHRQHGNRGGRVQSSEFTRRQVGPEAGVEWHGRILGRPRAGPDRAAAGARWCNPPRTPHDTPPEGQITTERRGAVLLIGIDRPAKRNGFTPPMFRQLGEAYTLLDDDPALRVGVLHAVGSHFTAGLDLPSIAPLMRSGEKAIPLGLVEPTDLGTPGYRRRTKPMVVAVKGITYTLGIELMLAADIVVAADDCRFSQLEVQRGIMATGGATLRMAERAGLGNAMLHLLTADEFGSAEALRLNFVQKVVPAGQELDEALRIAGAIAAQAPLAVVATRLNARKAVEQGPGAAMQEFLATQQRLANSADAKEGVQSFVEKRPAKFSGR